MSFHKVALIVFAVLSMVMSGCLKKDTPSPENKSKIALDSVAKKVAPLSLDEKIKQMDQAFAAYTRVRDSVWNVDTIELNRVSIEYASLSKKYFQSRDSIMRQTCAEDTAECHIIHEAWRRGDTVTANEIFASGRTLSRLRVLDSAGSAQYERNYKRIWPKYEVAYKRRHALSDAAWDVYLKTW